MTVDPRALAVAVFLLSSLALASSPEGNGPKALLERYEAEAGERLSAERGKELFERKEGDKGCTSCHGVDIKQEGRARFWIFSKKIGPMALSVNPKRFQKPKDTAADLDKYCQEVFGRVCTAREKGDLLVYFTAS